MRWWLPRRATRVAAVRDTAAWAGWAVWAAWECKDRAHDKTEDLHSMQCLPVFFVREAISESCAYETQRIQARRTALLRSHPALCATLFTWERETIDETVLV